MAAPEQNKQQTTNNKPNLLACRTMMMMRQTTDGITITSCKRHEECNELLVAAATYGTRLRTMLTETNERTHCSNCLPVVGCRSAALMSV